MHFKTLKQKFVTSLLATDAFIVKPINEEPFTLRSGKKSYLYTDLTKLAASPKDYKTFIEAMQDLLIKTYSNNGVVLCNVDSKISAQIVGAVAYNLQLPQIVYKSKALTAIEKGTTRQLSGDLTWDMPVAILDDVATGGDGTAKDVGDLVCETFPHIANIQIFVGVVREVKKTTYPINYILTRDELLAIVWDKLSAKQKQAVEKERAGL